MAGILFTDVRILDCTGAEPYRGEVLVEATRIAAVVREPQQLPREDNGRDRWLRGDAHAGIDRVARSSALTMRRILCR